MKKATKYLLSLVFVLSLAVIPMLSFAGGISPSDAERFGITAVEDGDLDLGNKSPIETATSLINTAMIFLGLIAVGIVLIGGFKWMTAGGGEEKITEAKKLMSAGVVGMIIILSAWSIAKFVIEKLLNATQ
jgi:Zn-dependent protease with chaperone function